MLVDKLGLWVWVGRWVVSTSPVRGVEGWGGYGASGYGRVCALVSYRPHRGGCRCVDFGGLISLSRRQYFSPAVLMPVTVLRTLRKNMVLAHWCCSAPLTAINSTNVLPQFCVTQRCPILYVCIRSRIYMCRAGKKFEILRSRSQRVLLRVPVLSLSISRLHT